MRVQIDNIKVNPGRREALPEHIEELLKSMAEVGLLNPITVDREYTLIAGLHRLEAAKRLGWAEIEATVSSLEGLQAELAEIDENFIRSDYSNLELGEILLRRKEIYEALHPDTKHGGDRKSEKIKASPARFDSNRSFVADTSDKLGLARRTIEQKVQIARDLTQEAKEIIRECNVGFKNSLKISRLPPDQQREAVNLLVSGQIKSIDEYVPETSVQAVNHASGESKEIEQINQGAASGGQAISEIHAQAEEHPVKDRQDRVINMAPALHKASETDQAGLPVATSPIDPRIVTQNTSTSPDPPYSLGSKRYATIKESVADLKDPNKDCSCTPDSFLAEIDAFVQKFMQEIEWFLIPYYEPALPGLTQAQLVFFLRQMDLICDAAHKLTTHVKEGWSNHGQKA